MCLGGRGGQRPPAPAPPPIINNPAPAPAPVQAPPPVAPPPPPRQISNITGGAEGGFKPGRKKKKDRSQVAKGTEQTRLPRVGVQIAGGGKSESGVGGLG